MEDPARERAAMVEFLRYQRPAFAEDMADSIANTAYPPGTDIEAATAARYADLADAWKDYLRRNEEYLAWRREREPGYTPPDEPDPNAWENLTEEQRREDRRTERLLQQARERIQGLSPVRRRVFLHTEEAIMEQRTVVHARLRRIAMRADADIAELAMATVEGFTRIEELLREIVSDGATLPVDDDDERAGVSTAS